MASDHSYGDHAATSDRVALSCRRLPVSGWRVGFLDPHDQLRVIVWRFDREQQHLADYYEPGENGAKPESLYGSVKMWAHLQREGIPVAKSTVERLMRANGWQGVRRQKTVRPTIPDPAAQRAPDLVDREFTVPAPNRFLLADFTYVKLLTGTFAYVAFVIDAFAGTIIGWEAATSKETRFVESAIRQAAALRSRQGHPIDGVRHPSDAGSQYTAVHFGETLSLSGLRPSIGSVGDAFDCEDVGYRQVA